jgi:adenylate cyclase
VASEHVERKLTTILAADVAGYSRLTGADEEGTMRRLRALRAELLDPVIQTNRGRVFHTAGDSILIEFASVVDAVRCSVDVQRGMAVRNGDFVSKEQIEFRIGIHLGDVMVQPDGDLLGDGVNIAARLEGIAEPGGICLSNAAYDQVRDKLKESFTDLGERELKNIARPVRVYRIDLAPAASAAAEAPKPTLALPDKPSIAVLPFQNISGDPEQEYFADGMVEDIITGLSRIKWVFVIARNSSFVYKDKAVGVKQVGRELGVRYVLEGSVRKASGRVRITGQLVEAETGAHLWADKYDGTLDDVFDLQDRITASVVGVVEPSLRQAEIERAKRKRPDNLDAYDLYLRALPHMGSVMPADARIAMGFLRDALTRDPNYAAAHALMAWCHEICFTTDGRFDETDRIAGIHHARAAFVGGADDATTLAVASVVILHLDRDRQTALNVIDRALALNGSSAAALYFGAHIHAWSGNAGVATDLAKRALRLSPFDPFSYEAHLAIGIAAIQEERYADAASSFANAVQANPRFSSLYAFQAAAMTLAGQLDEAKLVAHRLLELEPTFRSRIIREVGFVPAIADRLFSAFRQLGLPE